MIDRIFELLGTFHVGATVIASVLLIQQVVWLIEARRTWRRVGAGLIDGRTGLSNPCAGWEVDSLASLATERGHVLSIVVLRLGTGETDELGRRLAERVRASDVAIRWDVDEFVIALVTDSRAAAVHAVDRIIAGCELDALRCGITNTYDGSLWDAVRTASRAMRRASEFTEVAELLRADEAVAA